ncbi:MAG: HNH endonuclease, partial [Actinomycetota bacterium]|nr:HNH endonuclease [Actinomycetota bacterium]
MSPTPVTSAEPAVETAAGVLAAARASRAAADHEGVRLLRLAVEWAAMHSVDSIDHAAIFTKTCYGDQASPVAGPGAPLIAEFSVAEFAAAIGLPTETGKLFLGEAVELRYRLPRLWARVAGNRLSEWRARRIARETIALSPEGAAFVDAQVAGFAHKVRPSQVDRLVAEAITRYMPAVARRRRQQAADGRHVGVHTEHVTFEGTIWVEGELDLADGLDLDAALGHGAAHLAALGSQDTLDVRRSTALGDLARRQLALDLTTDDTEQAAVVSTPGAGHPIRPRGAAH